MPTHLMLGASVGLSDDELNRLADWPEAPVFDDTDRLVLRYTDAVTRDVRVEDALWEELAGRFSTRELFELCFSAGLAALVNRVHATFHTDVDERTQKRVAELGVHQGTVPEPRR